jgi:hypothetical protein
MTKMARETVIKCDICKKPTEKIVGKLFYAPTTRARGAKSFHNNYEMHLDVGVCCEAKLKKVFRWTRRVTAAAYHAARRAS